MRQAIRDLPIKRKIIAIALATTTVGLAVALLVMVVSEVLTARRTTAEYGSSLARVVALNTTAALAFRDPETANELLAGLASVPEVLAAGVHGPGGEVFARYASRDPRHAAVLERLLGEGH